jgi:hypothetical protein
VQKAANALVVPLSALSFQPAFSGTRRARTPKTGTTANAPATNGAPNASPWGGTTGSASTAITAGSQGRVFVQRNGKLVRVPVSIVLISGTQAAVAPAGDATLAAGDQVVTGGGATAKSGTRPQRPAGNPLAGGGAPGGGLRGIR